MILEQQDFYNIRYDILKTGLVKIEIFINAATDTLKMNCANFHKNLMGRNEMASISKLVRFFNHLI